MRCSRLTGFFFFRARKLLTHRRISHIFSSPEMLTRGALACARRTTFSTRPAHPSLVCTFNCCQRSIVMMVYEPPRAYERLPLPLETRIFGTHTARTRDICPGGCYIESVAHVTVGQFLVFEIQLPSGRWLELRGGVGYHRRK